MQLTGNVLITGGAGFLARAIYRRARREGWDARFSCLSRDDSKHAALQKRYPEVQTVVADVGLAAVERLTDLMLGFDTVIHAAAWKYVDRGEAAAIATIETNVLGSMRVAEAARRARVQRVIGISTDKATLPVNNYGATKFLMERVFQEASRLGDTQFTVVRYGNVAASTGSVIPIWREQAAAGKPIRLTDPDMTRFWMSPDEAVDTVLVGLACASGVVAIPECRAMSMHDLVLTVLGYDEHRELPTDGSVEIIGIRPGEKRHESLVQRAESVRAARGMGGYVYLAPPDSEARHTVPFEMTSDDPPGGWIAPADMRAIIADAEGI